MDHRLGLPADTVLGESYRIVRQIGSGGFGITYAAEDIHLGRTVAIKEYYPEEFGDRDRKMSVRAKSERHKPTFEWGRSSFLQEARTLARFQHPSVVRVTRVFEAHSTAYMVMDFEKGDNFEAWLKALGRPPTQEELDRIAAPLLDALEIMHAENFLHRDIAPDNVIIRPDGTPVLLDFGAARRAVAEKSRSLTGIVKAGYSPHEQYAADGRLQGPWTDLYALGATLYRAVVGTPPEEATLRMTDDSMRPASQVANVGYRAGFLNAIDACLISRPANRPQSVAQLRPLLLGGGSQRGANRVATRKIETSRPRRVGWPVVAAAAAVLLGGAYVTWEIVRRQTQETETKRRADAKREADAAAAAAALAGAQVRRQQDERAAAENRAAEERARRNQVARDPEAPYAEYFKDFAPAPAQPKAPSPAPAGGDSPRLGSGWIGIKMQSLTEGLADSFGGGQRAGALVAAVTPDSPAQKAGLREADVILRFDGKDIKAMPELLPAIRNATVGKTVDIDVLRDGERITLRATVGRTPGEEPPPSRRTRRRG